MRSHYERFATALTARGFTVEFSRERDAAFVTFGDFTASVEKFDLRQDWRWAVATVLRRWALGGGETSALRVWLLEHTLDDVHFEDFFKEADEAKGAA